MPRPTLVIAGGSGLVGRHLVAATSNRYDSVILTRKVRGNEPDGARAIAWNPRAARQGDEEGLERLAAVLDGAAAVINLAGTSIGAGRLGAEHLRQVLESRLDGTGTLVEAFGRARTPPPAWFQSSASGFYGDRGEELLDESAAGGSDPVLAETTAAWEAAVAPVTDRTRLLIGRSSPVLARDAPAWQRILLPIRLFVGGPLGSGRQWFPWIHIDDLVRAIVFLLESSESRGIYNMTSPQPVRQIQLARAAAQRLRRPAVVPVPAFALRLVLGPAAEALVLASTRLVPARLLEEGFRFAFPDLEAALDDLLR